MRWYKQAACIFENACPAGVRVLIYDVDKPHILKRIILMTAWCILTNPEACIAKVVTGQKAFVQASFVARVDQPQCPLVFTRDLLAFRNGHWEPEISYYRTMAHGGDCDTHRTNSAVDYPPETLAVFVDFMTLVRS